VAGWVEIQIRRIGERMGASRKEEKINTQRDRIDGSYQGRKTASRAIKVGANQARKKLLGGGGSVAENSTLCSCRKDFAAATRGKRKG